MEYVKLTDKNIQTFEGYQWVVGEKRTASGAGELCTEGWLHCYGAETQKQAVLLALLLNPIHADFPYPIRCFSAECGGQIRSDAGLKFGATEMTLREEITLLPEITMITRVAFGILCAMEVVKDRMFVAWGEGWLSGKDRSRRAARRAKWAAAEALAAEWSAEWVAERAAAVAAVEAVERAADRAVAVAAVEAEERAALEAAKRAVAVAAEPDAALEAAARVAMRALEAESTAALEAAARAARRAVEAATAFGDSLPLGELAEKAMEVK